MRSWRLLTYSNSTKILLSRSVLISIKSSACLWASVAGVSKDSFAAPWTVAGQVSHSMEFSRREEYSGLPTACLWRPDK